MPIYAGYPFSSKPTATSSTVSQPVFASLQDHYIGGDTEVHIVLPMDSAHYLGPPTFDMIYVEISSFYDATTQLAAVGRLRKGEGIIPESQMKLFSGEEDFLGAWVFEGDYRDLITILAQYEKRQDLLPGLNRHDSGHQMILAFLMASLDVVLTVPPPADLGQAIGQQATAAYAVPADYKQAEYLADGMAQMLQQVNPSDWPRITGPSWVGEERFQELAKQARARHGKSPIVVDDDFIVRMMLKAK